MKCLQLTTQERCFCILSVSFFLLLSQDMGHSQAETEGQDFAKQLTEMENLIASGVPEVHSETYCDQIKDLEKKTTCESGTAWGDKFASQIYKYQKGLKDLPWKQFKTSIAKLSEFRNRIAEKPVYGNCVLASYIDEVVQQWLLQKLIVNEDNLSELKKLSQISHRYFPIKTLVQMLENEYGKKVVDYKKFEKLSEEEQGVELGTAMDKLMGTESRRDPLDVDVGVLQILLQKAGNIILDYLILFKERNGAFPEDEKEFMAALEKTVPEIKRIIPELGGPVDSGALWRTYKEVKEKGLDAINILNVDDTADYSVFDRDGL